MENIRNMNLNGCKCVDRAKLTNALDTNLNGVTVKSQCGRFGYGKIYIPNTCSIGKRQTVKLTCKNSQML